MNGIAAYPLPSAHQLDEFATMLEQQRRFRVEQLNTHRTADVSRTQTFAEREIAETLIAGAREALAEIEAGQARLADGSYGRCVECSTQLPLERLEVLPYVARCLPCHRASPR
jgi:DnaK suppressor protein